MGNRHHPYLIHFSQYFGKSFSIDFTYGKIHCPKCSGDVCKHEFLATQGNNIKKSEQDLRFSIRKDEIERVKREWKKLPWYKRVFI